jgi:gliding motility-associated-like protein
MTIKRLLFFFISFLISSLSVLFAQVSADFTATVTQGCSPLIVQFSVLNNTNITSYEWNFGTAGSSILANPGITFNNEGVYDVTLIVNKGTATETSETKTAYITVFQKPDASFVVSSDTICVPFTVNFSDESVSPDFQITRWSWDFKNGSTLNNSTNPTPSNTYNNIGVYDVSLIVSNPTFPNCRDTAFQRIVAIEPPLALFSVSPTSACEPPLNVEITNLSADGYQYLWDFGNGNTTSSVSTALLTETYDDFGSYDISLTVTGYNNACNSSYMISNSVNIIEVVADISASTTLGCPYTNINFTASGSTNANSYFWEFGDGNTSTIVSPNKAYTTAGDYVVTLTAFDASGTCSNTTTLDVKVEDLIADFSVSEQYSCEIPFDVTFTDNSSSDVGSITGWNWVVDYNTVTSTPITTVGQNPVYTYLNEGLYNITLNVTSSTGCSVQVQRLGYIEVSFPRAVIDEPSILKGCEALTVDFTESSIADNQGTILSWSWDFDDGNTTTENLASQTVQNTFLTHGDYMVTLSIVNDRGCVSLDSFLIEVGSKPLAGFFVTPTISCARDDIEYYDTSKFVDPSVDIALLDEWIWSGSGGFGSTEQNPTHQYNQLDAIGLNNVELIVGYNGCYDTLNIDDYVEIIGPILERITTSVDCDFPFQRQFTAEYIDTTSYIWIFQNANDANFADTLHYSGGGSVTISDLSGNLGGTILGGTMDSPFYEFPIGISADYNIILIGWNAGANPFDEDSCEYSTSTLVEIRTPRAGFELSTTKICLNGLISFNALNDESNMNRSRDANLWSWDFGDGITTGFQSPITLMEDIGITRTSGLAISPTHQYNEVGSNIIKLVVQDIHGCMDSTIKVITVYRPKAGFTVDTAAGCRPFTVNFTDTTFSYLPITDYQWNFGNGFFSTDQNPTTTYTTKGNKSISLVVIDSLGCTSSASMQVTAIEPVANFTQNDETLCEDVGSVQFLSTSVPFSSTYPLVAWSWDFGNGETSDLQNPLYSYPDSGRYTVSLTVTDAAGCSHTIQKLDLIHVQATPLVGFFADQTYFDCPPAEVNFLDTTISDYITSYNWNLNVGGAFQSIDSRPDVSRNYDRGVYTIAITVTTSYGCSASVVYNDYITVDSPYAEFSADKSSACLNEGIVFTIDTINALVDSWQFIFGDGTIAENVNPYTHTYNTLPLTGNTYPITLAVFDADKLCPYELSLSILLESVEANLNLNFTTDTFVYQCTPFEVSFQDNSVGATSWSWDFDNGTTHDGISPNNIIFNNTTNQVDSFAISLKIDSDIGCTDTETKYVVVYPTPSLSVSNDTVICVNDSIQLVAISDATQYVWFPNLNINNNTIANPKVRPVVNTTYIVQATNQFGCETIDSVNVNIIPIPSFVFTPYPDTTIIIGDTANLSVDILDEGFKAFWLPPTDLTCHECNSPKFYGLTTTTYTLQVVDEDELCPIQEETITINVIEECRANIPNAFSPNGDGKNDVVYVKGWGIKEVLTFEIYNRWGERVYQNSGDKEEGWDGTFNGQPQNMDTYIIIANVQYYCKSSGEFKTEAFKSPLTLFR